MKLSEIEAHIADPANAVGARRVVVPRAMVEELLRKAKLWDQACKQLTTKTGQPKVVPAGVSVFARRRANGRPSGQLGQ